MKPLLAVAISGGIDSLVAAYLLKEQGHPVIGIHFTTGYETEAVDQKNNAHLSGLDETKGIFDGCGLRSKDREALI